MPNKNTSLKNPKKFATFAALFFCISVWFSSFAFAQNVVTSNANTGAGTLREIITNAPAGSEITFDLATMGTNEIILSSLIYITKNLTIDGGSGVIISGNNSSRIFYIEDAAVDMKNLTLKNGYDAGSGGAVQVSGINSNISFTAINCTFKNNSAGSYGGAMIIGGGSGSTVSFTAINCIFKNNNAHNTGAMVINNATVYLFHCTFDGNTATQLGDGICIWGADARLYAYNSIFTGSDNQIVTVSGGVNNADLANNLIQGVSANVTDRAEVFYVDDLVCGGIVETATVLTAGDISVPNHLTKTKILNWLKTDQAGKKRPKKGNVTYGAIEGCIEPPPPLPFKGNIIVRGGATLIIGK